MKHTISERPANNADNMQHKNQIDILQFIQRKGSCTRAEIAAYTGLTQAAVSKITAQLIQGGTIEETGLVAGRKGRRSIGLRIVMDGWKIIGVKLSRRNFSVGVFNFSGQMIEQFQRNIEGDNINFDDVILDMRGMISSFIERYKDVAAIGIAVPGPFLKDEKLILLISEQGQAPRFNIDLASAFHPQHFRNIPVILSHDANAAVLADWWFGIEDKMLIGTVVHFLLGEGVGAGVIVDGNVFTGAQGTAAEVGHVSVDAQGARCHCGNYGCLEMYCSSLALLEDTHRRRKQNPASLLNQANVLDAETVFRLADRGDETAIACVKHAAHYIGLGIVNIINCYNPDTILLCNQMAAGGELLLTTARETARQRVLPYLFDKVDISLSVFRGDDILFGAAAVAIDYCLSHPETLVKPTPNAIRRNA